MPKARKKRFFARNLRFAGLLLLSSLAACEPAAEEQAVAAPQLTDSGCGESGALQTSLFGSLETSVSWTGSDMMCENMLRPDNRGVRLRFAGNIAGERLAVIIALPELKQGEAATELRSNLTTTVEGSGRFFSTPNLDSCWTDIDVQTPVSGDQDVVTISGTVYCVAPLGEVNGDAAVSIPELKFTTILNWNKS